MTGTLINESNSELFLKSVPSDVLVQSDMFLGVYDDETDTACGVLAAEAIGEHRLAIRYIYVDEEFRLMGAGTELIETLIDVSSELEASSIVCALSRHYLTDYVADLLESRGFYKDPDECYPIYSFALREIEIDDIKAAGAKCLIKPLSAIDDKKWQSSRELWNNIKGPVQGLRALSYAKHMYDQDLSFAAFDKAGEILGVFFTITNGDNHEISVLSAIGDQAPKIMLALLDHGYETAVDKLGEDAEFTLSPMSPTSEGLLDKVSGGAYVRIGETDLYVLDLN